MFRSGKLAATEAGDGMQLTDDDSAGCYGSVFVDSSVETKLSPPPRRDAEPRFVAVVTEYRANPVVSRRGYLLITDGKELDEPAAVKRWVVRCTVQYLTLDQRSCYTSARLVLAWADKPPWCVTSHPDQLSLAILP